MKLHSRKCDSHETNIDWNLTHSQHALTWDTTRRSAMHHYGMICKWYTCLWIPSLLLTKTLRVDSNHRSSSIQPAFKRLGMGQIQKGTKKKVGDGDGQHPIPIRFRSFSAPRYPTNPATKRGFLTSCFVTSAAARLANLPVKVGAGARWQSPLCGYLYNRSIQDT